MNQTDEPAKRAHEEAGGPALADIDAIARLSMLDLEPDEKEALGRDIGRMIGFAQTVSEADTGGVAPSYHPSARKSVLREDGQAACIKRDELLKNAPAVDKGFVFVPKTVDI